MEVESWHGGIRDRSFGLAFVSAAPFFFREGSHRGGEGGNHGLGGGHLGGVVRRGGDSTGGVFSDDCVRAAGGLEGSDLGGLIEALFV